MPGARSRPRPHAVRPLRRARDERADAEHGGFEHNRQTLRILELLERRYPEFPGLNLTWEVREGIIKHRPDSDAQAPAEYAPGEAPTLEAQLVDYVDEIAYNNHDVDDGLSSGMFSVEAIREVALFREAHDDALRPQARATSGSSATTWCASSSTLRAGADRGDAGEPRGGDACSRSTTCAGQASRLVGYSGRDGRRACAS